MNWREKIKLGTARILLQFSDRLLGRDPESFNKFLSEKAKTSKFWAILLTLAVLYEIVEHIVWPILVPWLMYLQWFK